MFSKDIIASGDYLYLRNFDKRDKKPFSQDVTVLWNRDIAGPIGVYDLGLIINLLKKGNVRKKKSG